MLPVIVTLLNVAAAVVVARAAGQAVSPLPPSQDPFYSAPAGYEDLPPGAVLRLREAPGNLTSIFNASSKAYNIVYRTTNSRYQPAWAVTTVFQPRAAPSGSSGVPLLLSYQIPYNTADVDASPSFAFYSSGLAGDIVLSDIQSALEYGWYVNVPDFEGPLTSFTSGVSEGHATLDSIRAVLASSIDEAISQSRYAMWGYSGGSIASEWAAELSVQYAPEMNFSGIAIGGVVPNGTSVINAIDGTPGAGLLPAVLLGLTSQYPDAYNYLISNLKLTGEFNATGFLATRNYSVAEAFVHYANQTILRDYFVNGEEFLESPIMQKIIHTDFQQGYHGVPPMPAYIYKAVQDEFSAISDTDALVDRYCGNGANILYERNTIGNHLDEETNGDASALAWLRDVLEERAMPQMGCIVRDVAINITSHGPFGGIP